MGTTDVPLPDSGSLLVLGAGILIAVGIVGLTLPLLGQITATEETRFE